MLLANHFQNAYVTADLDAALAVLAGQFGIARQPRVVEARQDFTSADGTGEGVLRIALIPIGRLVYEIIQPVSGNVRVYAECVSPDRLLTLHHVAMRTDDIESVRAQSAIHGRPVALEGAAAELDLRFIYVDARDTLGHYLEYVQAPDAFWGGRKA